MSSRLHLVFCPNEALLSELQELGAIEFKEILNLLFYVEEFPNNFFALEKLFKKLNDSKEVLGLCFYPDLATNISLKMLLAYHFDEIVYYNHGSLRKIKQSSLGRIYCEKYFHLRLYLSTYWSFERKVTLLGELSPFCESKDFPNFRHYWNPFREVQRGELLYLGKGVSEKRGKYLKYCSGRRPRLHCKAKGLGQHLKKWGQSCLFHLIKLITGIEYDHKYRGSHPQKNLI